MPPQRGRDQDAPLLVRRDLGRAGQQHPAQLVGVGQARLGEGGKHLVPGVFGKGHQASVQPAGDDKAVAHLVAELGGEIQTAFGVDGIVELADEHTAIPSLQKRLYPLLPTSTIRYIIIIPDVFIISREIHREICRRLHPNRKEGKKIGPAKFWQSHGKRPAACKEPGYFCSYLRIMR